MTTGPGAEPGAIVWHDLTVPNATEVRDFYAAVVGWSHVPVDMGDHEDFGMVGPDPESAVAGICHALGPNAGLPPQWLLYVTVTDLNSSIKRCNEMGGRVISEPRGEESGISFCVIQDPAGAVIGLMQAG